MTHVAVIALLALSLNNTPPNTGVWTGKAKSAPRPAKPQPQPPDKPSDTPSEPRPETPPPEAEEPRPTRPGRGEPSHDPLPQYREEPHLTVIRRNMHQVESCFASARAWAPALQGEVIVEWDISPSGDVEKAEVTGNTTGKPDLAACILQAVKGWKFRDPNTSYPGHVRHPFRFQAL